MYSTGCIMYISKCFFISTFGNARCELRDDDDENRNCSFLADLQPETKI